MAFPPRRQWSTALATWAVHVGPAERWLGPRKSATQLGRNSAAHTAVATTALIDIAGALVGVAGEGLAAQVEKPRLTETPSRVK